MSAAELRQAAETLRERAGAATPGPWHVDEIGDFGDKGAVLEIVRWRGYTNTAHFGEDRPTADYIATMHPGVAFVLADWLDHAAERYDPVVNPAWVGIDAVRMARLINGGAA